MENILVKYSEFIFDDGGFDKVRKDFEDLENDLVKRAKILKDNVKIFDPKDSDYIRQLETKVEDITKAFKKLGDAKEDVNKIEKAYIEQKKKEIETTDDQIDKLTELDKQLRSYQDQLAEINTLQKAGIKTDRDLNKERVQAQLNIKLVTKQIQQQQQEVIKSTELSKQEQKLLQAKLTLEKTEIKTLDDVRERMSALRVVVQSMDYREQADEIRKMNQEIDDLTQTLSENSDKFIQNKINIGNYEESIVNALKKTNLFRTNIAVLDNALDSLADGLFKTSQEIADMEEKLGANTTAIERLTISFGKMNKALKASVIGLVVVAMVALSSMFGNTRAGAIRMEKTMMALTSTLQTFGKIAKVYLVSGLKSIFYLWTFQWDKLKDEASKGMAEIKDAFASGTEAIILGLEYIDEAFRIEDQVRKLNRELEVMNGNLAILQARAGDATRSLSYQLNNSRRAMKLQEEIAVKQLDIAKKNLEVVNNRIKQNALSNVEEAKSLNLQAQGVEFAQQVQQLAQQRGSDLEISNELIQEQQDALLEVIKVENELKLAREENAIEQRQILQDIFEQNLDLLIDLIDTEKNLSEQLVNDVAKSFENRVNEFNRFLIVFRQNAQRELDQFTDLNKKIGNNLKFKIAFKEDGNFDIFMNNTKLAIDDIVKLNSQLQKSGMSEIQINRFRELLVETRNGVRDFRQLNKELKLVGVNIMEMKSNLEVTQEELNSYDLLTKKLQNLKEQEIFATTTEERKRIEAEIEKLEKEKTHIQELGDIIRKRNRQKAIDDELKLVEEGSSRYYELMQERLDIEKDLQSQGVEKMLDRVKNANEKSLEDYKKWADQIRALLDAILDRVIQVEQKRVDTAQNSVQKQSELVDEQKRRAEQGLTNTLAFEQREMGKREAELIKRQKRLERLEKIKALYSSYNNYASQGEKEPITKALRDFALLEAITASFGDGGVVEDKLPTDGIFRGQSHNGNRGGIPILVEGREGIFSAREMDNLGKDNFYKIKHRASLGKVDENFFSHQRKKFMKMSPNLYGGNGGGDPRLIEELKSVKDAIESKPVPNMELHKLADGILDIVMEEKSKNSTRRTHFIVKRKRF